MKAIAASRTGAGLIALAVFLTSAVPGRADPAAAETSPAKIEPSKPEPAKAPPAKSEPAPTKLSCKAGRGDIGIFEPLRFMSITIDLTKKYVKMVHEGDGKSFEYTDGGTSAQGRRNFVKVTDESISYGQQGYEAWKIDRYTGTLTNSSFTIPFECQLRPAERKF
ncbi:MAG: hypothetical protein ACLPPF_10400 [Rhodomicrobium sp.]